MSVRSSLLALALLGSLSAGSMADTLLIPPDLPETNGVSTALRSAPRTYMSLYMPVNFAAVSTPVLITGMQLRISADGNDTLPAAWPSAPLTFASFDVQLSQASATVLSDGEFVSSAVTFASQQAAGTVVSVRSGAMTVDTGSYQNSGAENAFGAVINFTTPYLYSPGQSLLLYLTHTGYTPSTEPQPFFATTDYTAGQTDAISSTVGYQAASAGGFTSPYIVQFTTTPVPEPASMLMLAAGVAGLLTLRRLRPSSAQA